MKNKRITAIMLCSTMMLSSCFNVPRFSNGYQFDGYPQRDAIAYRTETNIYSYLEDIPITIGIGHYGGYSSKVCDENVKVQLLLSAQKSIDLQKNYVLEEFTGSEYCSDTFLVENDFFKGKTFAFERDYEIPKSLFHFLKENNSHNLDIVISCIIEDELFTIRSLSISFKLLSDNKVKFVY